MITLQDWFYNKSTKYFLRVVVITLVAWVLTAVVLIYKTNYEFENELFQSQKTITIAISQRNQVLLESILSSTLKSLNLKEISVCKDNEFVASVNGDYNSCLEGHLSKVILLSGFSGYTLRANINYFSFYFYNGLFLIVILFIFILILLMLNKVQSNIKNEIILPLVGGLLADSNNSTTNNRDQKFLIEEFYHLKLSLEKAKESEKIKLIAETAQQVSHDIRSPLSALNMIIGSLKNIPEEHRIMMRSAVHRINDIANQLLQKSKNKKEESEYQSIQTADSSKTSISNVTVELLPAVVDMLISEKRVQFREKSNIAIETEFEESYGAFAEISSSEFKRVISNLINNSVEAMKREGGRILTSIKNYPTKTLVLVRDNGNGIPLHILDKLGQQGVTFGKEGTDSGSGLGIYHAKKTIESFGAKFIINSQEGRGTEIRMEFPKCNTPNWFVPELKLRPDQTIVALDDDNSVLEIWKNRFKDFNNLTIKLHTYTSANDFIEWINLNFDSLSNTLFLIDFELLGQKNNGLDLIEAFRLNDKSILVTSRYEETAILKRCEHLNVNLIPKAMAPFVPIEISKT